jgi:hypothetical protein
LVTHDDPAARAGALLNAVSAMTELVDTGLMRTLPRAIPSRQFLGYAIADRAGGPLATSREPRSPNSASTPSTSTPSNTPSQRSDQLSGPGSAAARPSRVGDFPVRRHLDGPLAAIAGVPDEP